MRKLLQPEIRKATGKARNTSKSVFNTWLNEQDKCQQSLSSRQTGQLVPHTCWARGRGSLGRSPVWTPATLQGYTSHPSRVLAHMAAVMAVIPKEVLSLLHVPRTHICAVEVACALKPVGLCLFQLRHFHWDIYYKVHKYFHTKFELVITDMSMLQNIPLEKKNYHLQTSLL